MLNINIDSINLSNRMKYIIIAGIFVLIFVVIIYLMKNPDIIKTIFGKEGSKESTTELKTVQLKGIMLFKGKPQINLSIKIKEYTYSDITTDMNGEFKFKGISYSNNEKIVYLQVKCNEGYKDVKSIDFTNTDRYVVKNGWIELGPIELEEEPCKSVIEPKKEPQYKSELPKITKTEINEMVIINVNLNAKNFNDNVLIDEKIVPYEKGSFDQVRFIKVEANKVHTIRVGNCDVIERMITKTSEKNIYPCI